MTYSESADTMSPTGRWKEGMNGQHEASCPEPNDLISVSLALFPFGKARPSSGMLWVHSNGWSDLGRDSGTGRVSNCEWRNLLGKGRNSSGYPIIQNSPSGARTVPYLIPLYKKPSDLFLSFQDPSRYTVLFLLYALLRQFCYPSFYLTPVFSLHAAFSRPFAVFHTCPHVRSFFSLWRSHPSYPRSFDGTTFELISIDNLVVTDVFLFQKTIDLRYLPNNDNSAHFEDHESVSELDMMPDMSVIHTALLSLPTVWLRMLTQRQILNWQDLRSLIAEKNDLGKSKYVGIQLSWTSISSFSPLLSIRTPCS